jgi:hypothetical protein
VDEVVDGEGGVACGEEPHLDGGELDAEADEVGGAGVVEGVEEVLRGAVEGDEELVEVAEGGFEVVEEGLGGDFEGRRFRGGFEGTEGHGGLLWVRGVWLKSAQAPAWATGALRA